MYRNTLAEIISSVSVKMRYVPAESAVRRKE